MILLTWGLRAKARPQGEATAFKVELPLVPSIDPTPLLHTAILLTPYPQFPNVPLASLNVLQSPKITPHWGPSKTVSQGGQFLFQQ